MEKPFKSGQRLNNQLQQVNRTRQPGWSILSGLFWEIFSAGGVNTICRLSPFGVRAGHLPIKTNGRHTGQMRASYVEAKSKGAGQSSLTNPAPITYRGFPPSLASRPRFNVGFNQP